MVNFAEDGSELDELEADLRKAQEVDLELIATSSSNNHFKTAKVA